MNTIVGSMPLVISSTPQYTSIRNGLVANAVLANREVDGIILRVEKEDEGSAIMIKFKDDVENKGLAKVNNYKGIYVFIDNKPITNYSSIKRIKAKGVWDGSPYSFFVDKFTKKACKLKEKQDCMGVILHLVEGGTDYADAIKFL
ncbi:MAG: hypothetical protein NC038_07745 [Paludibacter sp.]|nr:hypothetical protein [Bacteroidales bacterium]MCM1354653.1 hypothetical protein [Bacteroides sp.]MCM1403874.1 hypothetical protein [Bacteroides sp.]MCM1443635.1 hypothetical protein [Muribaculum sp.]MCM1482510.1 hypothetical protein [Paludibacter sp.]